MNPDLTKELLKRPFCRLLFLWITGILLQYWVADAFRWSYLLLLPAVAGMASAAWMKPDYIYERRWWWGSGFACLLVFIAVQVTCLQDKQTDWEPPVQNVIAQIRLEDNFREKPRSLQYPVTLLSYQAGDTVYTCRKKIYAYFAKDSLAAQLSPGDCVWVQARFYSLTPEENPPYYRFLRNKGISATAYIPAGKWKKAGTASGLSYKMLRWRNRIIGKYNRLEITPSERAVLSALTLGYTAGMTSELRSHFSAVGVAHLLAVSGFHVAVVAGIVSLLLSFLPKHGAGFVVKYGVTLVLLWLFVTLTGMAVSAIRAGLMFTFYWTGKLLRRQSEGYNTLAAVAFCMLVYRPYNLFDIGFQLSFLAVWSILYLQPRISSLLTVRNPLLRYPWQGMSVTIAAQVGTAPLCMYIFGTVPLVFLFTNLPLAILSTFLIPCAFFWVMWEWWIPGGIFLRCIPETLVHWILYIVEAFRQVRGSSVVLTFGFGEMLATYAMLFFFLLYRWNRRPKALLASLSCVLILLLLLYVRRNM